MWQVVFSCEFEMSVEQKKILRCFQRLIKHKPLIPQVQHTLCLQVAVFMSVYHRLANNLIGWTQFDIDQVCKSKTICLLLTFMGQPVSLTLSMVIIIKARDVNKSYHSVKKEVSVPLNGHLLLTVHFLCHLTWPLWQVWLYLSKNEFIYRGFSYFNTLSYIYKCYNFPLHNYKSERRQ